MASPGSVRALTGAERIRRHRARQAAGHLSVTTDFTPAETAKLCRLRYLTECELEDRRPIAAAIHTLLAHILDV